MKTIIKWVLILGVLAGLSVYFGGGKWLQNMGKKSVQVGEKLEKAEKKAKDVTKDAEKKLERLKEKVKE